MTKHLINEFILLFVLLNEFELEIESITIELPSNDVIRIE